MTFIEPGQHGKLQKGDAKHVSPVLNNLIKRKMRDKVKPRNSPMPATLDEATRSEQTSESVDHFVMV